MPKAQFTVAGWVASPDRNVIRKEDAEVRLEPRVMELLCCFARHPGEVLSGDRLMTEVWNSAYVSDSALLSAVSALRRAFGDDARRPTVIQTIPKRGYRLIAPCETPAPTLAVLPFQVAASEAPDDFFAAGVTDLLIAELGKLAFCRVISRQSVMRYAGSAQPLPRIAAALGADLVIEGSVQRTGEQVAMTLRLVDAATDHQIWGDHYEHALTQAFDVQRLIAADVTRAVSARLEQSVVGPAAQDDVRVAPEALVSYLRGRYHFARLAPEHFDRALGHFRDALAADPAFAPAHAGIADVWGAYGYWGLRPPSQVRSHLYEAVSRGYEIDPASPEIQMLLGAYHFYYERDFATAETHFRRALELNPNLAHAHLLYALLLSTLRRPAAAAEVEHAIRLDPLNPAAVFVHALRFANAGDYDTARAEVARALDLEPYHPPSLQLVADLDWLEKDPDALASERALWVDDRAVHDVLADETAVTAAAALEAAVDVLDARRQWIFVSPTSIARLLVHAGRAEDALDQLEAAEAADELVAIDLLQLAPAWNPLRGHPRFAALCARIDVPH